MRLMIVQYGNYLDALVSREKGFAEQYRAQYDSLDVIDNVVKEEPCLILCLGNYEEDTTTINYEKYEKDIALSKKNKHNIKYFVYNNYEIVYGNFLPKVKESNPKYKDKISTFILYHWQVYNIMKSIKQVALDFAPSHIIIRTTGWLLGHMGSWAVRNNIPILPLLADYEESRRGLRTLFTARHIKLLQSERIPLVCNHNYPASESLVRAGVSPSKVVPWDWPCPRHPAISRKRKIELQTSNVHQLNGNVEKLCEIQGKTKHIKLLYAGLLRYDKGLGDIFHALSMLNDESAYQQNKNLSFSLLICGNGPDRDSLIDLAERLGLSGIHHKKNTVHFCGKITNKEVHSYMENVDVVLVPSWHSYPEGMPNVIYEAFEAYTPVIISDHPSFVTKLTNGQGCLIVEQQNVKQMSLALLSISQESQYQQITSGIIDAWEKIQCPVLFQDVILQWKSYTQQNKVMDCLKYSLDDKNSKINSK